MTFLTKCPPCSMGDHSNHYEVVQVVPAGTLGGAVCLCEGECEEEAVVDLTHQVMMDMGWDWDQDRGRIFQEATKRHLESLR